ncbi:CoA-transferase family III domain-containing protein [Xylariaceae sp. FL1272]|nr:CoA-transferase family III domain-containing protein [Xylariaceae sp. FL1272]
MASSASNVDTKWEDYRMDHEARNVMDRILLRIGNHDEHGKNSLPISHELIRSCEIPPGKQNLPYFSIPLKETETIAALRAIEGSLALALYNLRCTRQSVPIPEVDAPVEINLEHVTNFMMQSYTTVFHEVDEQGAFVDSFGKLTKRGKEFMMQERYNTDLLHAQSDPLNRLLGAIYEADKGTFYHLHQSLNPKPTCDMIGLTEEDHKNFENDTEGFRDKIREKISGNDADFWDKKGMSMGQAGVKVMKHEDFLATSHGKEISRALPWTVERVDTGETKPFGLPPLNPDQGKRPLQGVVVIEFCRIIAGPTIGRILAEYGAEVHKISGPDIPDVPWFQVDVNMGKQHYLLDLKNNPKHKEFFRDSLLKEAHIILDGYTPGAIPRLLGRLFGAKDEDVEGEEAVNYIPSLLKELKNSYQKEYVYVTENCFGHYGDWKSRRGWQQIADCVTGVAMIQGNFMFPEEDEEKRNRKPIVPPFPISDYGCASMGAIAALSGLWQDRGSSWIGRTSIVQYDLLLIDQGEYGPSVKHELRQRAALGRIIDPDYYRNLHFGVGVEGPPKRPLELECFSSVDEVSGAFFYNMVLQYTHELFDPMLPFYEYWFSPKYRWKHDKKRVLVVQAVKPVVRINGLAIEHQRSPEPNPIEETEIDDETKLLQFPNQRVARDYNLAKLLTVEWAGMGLVFHGWGSDAK